MSFSYRQPRYFQIKEKWAKWQQKVCRKPINTKQTQIWSIVLRLFSTVCATISTLLMLLGKHHLFPSAHLCSFPHPLSLWQPERCSFLLRWGKKCSINWAMMRRMKLPIQQAHSWFRTSGNLTASGSKQYSSICRETQESPDPSANFVLMFG